MASADKGVAGTKDWDKYAPGMPGRLSAEQDVCVCEMMARLPAHELDMLAFPLEPHLSVCCRFLRARKFDVDAAVALVKRAVQYSSEHGIQALRGRDPMDILGCAEDEIAGFYPKAYWPTFDREGRPIFVERTGAVDVDSMLMLSTMDRLVQYHLYCNETGLRDVFRRASERAGAPITSLVSIMDMEGMSMKLVSATVRNFVAALTSVDGVLYPETLGKMLIINAPSIFQLGWRMVSGFLDERTVRKIEILGGPSEWRPRLEALVDPANIPEEYGGKLHIPGGLFPRSRTASAVVAAGKTFQIKVSVTSGQRIAFKWCTKSGDLRFGVDHESNEHKATVCKPSLHSDCDKGWINIECVAPNDGTLLATWDNTKAWLQRDMWHRWDLMVDGRPEVTTRQSALAAGIVSPKATTHVSASAAAAMPHK